MLPNLIPEKQPNIHNVHITNIMPLNSTYPFIFTNITGSYNESLVKKIFKNQKCIIIIEGDDGVEADLTISFLLILINIYYVIY